MCDYAAAAALFLTLFVSAGIQVFMGSGPVHQESLLVGCRIAESKSTHPVAGLGFFHLYMLMQTYGIFFASINARQFSLQDLLRKQRSHGEPGLR